MASSEDTQDSGAGVRVVDRGEGRPVVLIHGWPLTADSWSEQVEALVSGGYRVVTYDRRGFGGSDPGDKYDYDALAGDLANIIDDLDLQNAVIVGFSMGGGEVARYLSKYGDERIAGAVFAGAVPPYLLKGDDNPDGPLEQDAFDEMRQGVVDDADAFFEDFTTSFFSAGDDLKVTDEQRATALEQCKQADHEAVLGCMDAWATTDFRDDLAAITVPTLVIHGDSDGVVPFEGSGKRTHDAIDSSELIVVADGPHGFNVSHADEFNEGLLGFLGKLD